MSNYNWEEIRKGVNQVGTVESADIPVAPLPSAEDLDAVAEEQRIRDIPLPWCEVMTDYFAYAAALAREAAKRGEK